ncbi:hypothetical protein [Granulicella arctica]|uniref:hypothetical protein n=1 Tax=Granulicella arctica TaxID=940613 RepID=UPI0021E0621D|nr:hypothetical protein [Granulicella arctica]
MTEIYSVVAAFGTNADANNAAQLLERSGFERKSMSIENRITPIQRQEADMKSALSQMKLSTITGALWGGLWAFLANGDRFSRNRETVVFMDPLLSCLGSVVKGACMFAGVTFIGLSLDGGISRLQLMHDEPTLALDPYLLIIHNTPAAVTLAGDVLKTAQAL